ncbi:MAG: NUDIX hydrolase [Lachnospiraceae bacterium]|nr:NUDIX hydrolase [Lachnospiraceae bacterium]
MGKILKVTQVTDNRFLNMYDLEVEDKFGNQHPYQVASRARHKEDMKLATGKNKPDGVIIYALYGEQKDHVVLIRQYRYSIGNYIYEFPAGLIDGGEDFHKAGVRELREETGLTFHPVEVDPIYSKPYFTTIGMTDESCAAVYGTAEGEISKKEQEETEEIEVVLADRKEVLRILREEHVSLMCAYMMMHFLHEDPKDPFGFLEGYRSV